jgi:hypothetical protein
VFLKSFEKLAALHKIPKLEWALRLVPLLCGKALEAFSRLPDEDSNFGNPLAMLYNAKYKYTKINK